MYTVHDIAQIMESFAPPPLAREWDNVGLLAGDGAQNVRRILVALDMDSCTLEEALRLDVDMIITHHPVFFEPCRKITNETLSGRLVCELIRRNISLFTAHTNLDSTEGGVNDVLAQKLGLSRVEKPETKTEGFDGGVRTGIIKPCSFSEFAKLVKTALDITIVKCVGDRSSIVSKIAVCGGSGAFALEDAYKNGCDVLVTGEAKYNDEQLADDLGICMIEAGHFETENVVCPAVAKHLQSKTDGIEIFVSSRNTTYYYYE